MGRHTLRPLAILAVLGFLHSGQVQAQFTGKGPKDRALVIFKDGFYVSGRVTQPKDFVLDSATGASFTVPLAGGFFYVEDGVRRIHFSPRQVLEVLPEDPNRDRNLLVFGHTAWTPRNSLPPGWEMKSMGDWGPKWDRKIEGFFKNSSPFSIDQRMTYLTPEFAWVTTKNYAWAPCYFTKELGPKTARKLVYDYLTQGPGSKKELTEEAKQLMLFKFLYQAGWLDQADTEMTNFKERFPSKKDETEVKDYEEKLKRLRATVFIDDLLMAHKVGQPKEVREALDLYDKKEMANLVPEKRLKVQEIKNFYRGPRGIDNKLKEAARLLEAMPAKAEAANRAFFTKAATAIAEDLHADAVGRLETFVQYARQFEKKAGLKVKNMMSADEILALALSGWLQGDVLAATDVKMARALWKARDMVLEYQKAEELRPRKQILDALETLTRKHQIPVDVIDRLIQHLPPPTPYEKKIGTDVIELKIDVDGPAQGTGYLVLLPPEYHHQRSYPVLFALHAAGDKPQAMMSRLAVLAAKNGYILVAPLYAPKPNFQYGYSAREHSAVTDCLRDLRRKFQIDSDRVFLLGWRQGGNMAFDVGLSHPDLFAGVLTMNGSPLPYGQKYWSNGQYVPFYCVDGDMNGKFPSQHRQLFKEWIRGQYPSLYVEYKGRGSEWFSAELPIMFDWMNRKVRAAPLKQLGLLHTGGRSGEEFRSNRETDNHFYWLSTDSILPRHLAGYAAMLKNAPSPATLQATIVPGNYLNVQKGVAVKNDAWNQVNVRCFGVSQITVSLGAKMIDWNLPVRFRVNASLMTKERLIKPSLATLLEDFHHHGDRQRLVYAKLEARFK